MIPNPQARPYLLLTIILLVGAGMCTFVCWYAYEANGSFGFPLDDPWIHLQFARNVHDFGAYSYFRNDTVTSGSTSPLYTFLLTAGFFVTNNEMLMSYILGVGFLLAAGIYLLKSSLVDFNDNILLAGGVVFLVLFEPRLQWIALSGMETTLFIFLLAAAMYYYKVRSEILAGIASGLLLWARPEAFIFLGAVLIDLWYHDYVVKLKALQKKPLSFTADFFWWLKRFLLGFSIFGLVYAGFNLWLSGSIFPNSFSAKIRYYSQGVTDFPGQVLEFLTAGHFSVLSYFAAIGIVSILFKIVRRESNPLLLPFLWSAGMFIAYWDNLPYLYQEGRYLMPILPSVILIAVGGLDSALKVAKHLFPGVITGAKALPAAGLVLLLFAGQFAVATWNERKTYTEYCRYITDRQVRTAKWIRANLPSDAVVGTHDIGAIAYYSGRRIADMVGLVSPEMIENIGSLDRLRQFLIEKKTTHLAVLRNWFEIVNVNPIFQTDERYPEIMEVFAFDPNRVRFTPQRAGRTNELATRLITAGNTQQAVLLLQQSLRIDPYSSRTHVLLAGCYTAGGNLEKGEDEYRAALRLHPILWEAQMGLAQIAVKRRDPQKGIAQLESLIRQNPAFAPAYRALAGVYQDFAIDTTKASEYRDAYDRLQSKPPP